MRQLLLAGLSVFTMSASAMAEDATYACQRDNVVRNVSVVGTEGSGHVCEVRYQRTSEGGEPQLLWHAQSDPKFCDSQATALVGRLQDAGWACTTGDGQQVRIDRDDPKAASADPGMPSGVTAAIQPAPAMQSAPKAAADPSLMQLRPTIH